MGEWWSYRNILQILNTIYYSNRLPPDKEHISNYGLLVSSLVMMIYMYSYGGTLIYSQVGIKFIHFLSIKQR